MTKRHKKAWRNMACIGTIYRATAVWDLGHGIKIELIGAVEFAQAVGYCGA